MMNKLLFLACFYISWYLSVEGAVSGHELRGACFVAFVTIIFLINVQKNRLQELLFIGVITVSGSLIDSILPNLGLVSFSSIPELPWGYPIWLASLWTIFAIGLSSALVWLQNRYILASAIGAIGGPLSYIAGASMGAIHFHSDLWMIVLFNAIEWAVIFPVSLKLYKLLVLKN